MSRVTESESKASFAKIKCSYILMNTSGQIYAIIVCQLQLIPNADLPLSAHLTPQKLHKSKPKFSDMYFKCG